LSAQLGDPAGGAVFEARPRRLPESALHAVLVVEGDGAIAGRIGLEQRLPPETGNRIEIVGLMPVRVAKASDAR
jgi:hypothetical protein